MANAPGLEYKSDGSILGRGQSGKFALFADFLAFNLK